MIIFTSRLFDVTYSPLILFDGEPGSKIRSVERRVSRSATLDGGSIIDDAGFADGDRVMEVVIQSPSTETDTAIRGMMVADGTQRVATVDGVFEGSIEKITETGRGKIQVRFLVAEKKSA